MNGFVCIDCLNDAHLESTFGEREKSECTFCDKERPGLALDDLATLCEEAIHSSFTFVQQPDSVVHFNHPPIGYSLSQVLDIILGAAHESIIQCLLEELLERWSDYDQEEPSFIETTEASHQITTDLLRMEESLQYESRLVNPDVNSVLERVFEGIEQLQVGADLNSVIVMSGPGHAIDAFQRARQFESEADMAAALKHPENHLGPRQKGEGSAGRMNAKGISVFYGSTDVTTAIAEVRPAVGSFVVTAKFELIRPLRLLNLESLSSVRPDQSLSYFSPVRKVQAERCAFLRQLRTKMLIPVMPGGTDKGYLITQAISDYLATHPTLNLDGILFPSVQVAKNAPSGLNVILFFKASGVEGCNKSDEVEHVSLWEADEDRLFFYPEIYDTPPTIEKVPVGRSGRELVRLPSMRLNRDHILIHIIEGVSYNRQTDPVRHTVWSDRSVYHGPR